MECRFPCEAVLLVVQSGALPEGQFRGLTCWSHAKSKRLGHNHSSENGARPARERGYEIVHPLTEEAWGPRRFFVRDPHGVVVNVIGHPD
jgi:hypothetical protein